MDKRVITIPYVNRFLLVNGIIAPFRSPRSASEYIKLKTFGGKLPLTHYGQAVCEGLQKKLAENFTVALGMRYQSPSMEEALQKLQDACVHKIILIPLFPQYASATTSSVSDKFFQLIKKWEVIPHLSVIQQFYQRKDIVKTIASITKEYTDKNTYDKVIFSYHGIPEKHILASSVNNSCKLSGCCGQLTAKNVFCYRAQCFHNSRLLAEAMQVKMEDTITCFQSRLGKTPWIKPYTDHVLSDLPQQGVKKVLIMSPSFVADCLETTVEIGETYHDLFLEKGGEQFDLVNCMNEHPLFIEALAHMVHEQNLNLP